MGCWDIYCFICGNPCHGILPLDKKYIIENIKLYEDDLLSGKKIGKNHSKQTIKLYNMHKADPKFIKNLENFIKSLDWMNKCTFLTADDRVVHGCREVGCNITFLDKKKNRYEHNILRDDFSVDEINGIFIHTDCWKFLQNSYDIKLKYSDLPITFKKNNDLNKVFNFINYGEIERYWAQYFNFVDVITDNKRYLCSSPLLDDKNVNQIIKNFNALKIRYTGQRKGPSVSASFYKNGDIKIGNNGKFWMIKNKKWVEINENVKTLNFDITDVKDIRKLKYIGEPTDIPVFVVSLNRKSKKNITVKLLTVESHVELLIKKYS